MAESILLICVCLFIGMLALLVFSVLKALEIILRRVCTGEDISYQKEGWKIVIALAVLLTLRLFRW